MVMNGLWRTTEMNEIEKTEGEIKVLQAKLELLKEMEKHKTPCEEAYKRVYGNYPTTHITDGCWDSPTWMHFLNGYKSAQKDYKVGEHQEEPEEEPEETEQSLKEAFVKAQQTENWKEIQKKIDAPAEGIYDNIDVNKLLEKWEKDPPEFLKFELGQSLYDLIADWWDEIFMNNNEAAVTIESLVEDIENWLPKEQSAAGSQNAYVESAVEGFNDCLNKIKRKL